MFNFLPYFADGWPESQLAEGGVNATDNCGGASGSLVMMAYGYPDIEPQTWTDYEYGPSYHGGMTLESLVNFVQTHFPNPPPMAIEAPANVAAAIADYGAQGFPCIGWFYCDSSANILQYPSPISHFSPVIEFDGNIFSIRNVWRGYINTFNAAQFNAASVGRILVFKRSLNMSTRRALVRLAYMAGLGREPESVTAIDGWANGNSDDEAMVTAILDSSEGVTYRSRLRSGVAGPAGPAGPADEVLVDTSQFAKVKHGHSGPVSLSGSVDVI